MTNLKDAEVAQHIKLVGHMWVALDRLKQALRLLGKDQVRSKPIKDALLLVHREICSLIGSTEQDCSVQRSGSTTSSDAGSQTTDHPR